MVYSKTTRTPVSEFCAKRLLSVYINEEAVTGHIMMADGGGHTNHRHQSQGEMRAGLGISSFTGSCKGMMMVVKLMPVRTYRRRTQHGH